ncbi:MAG: DUF3299 domain-containing protein [Planctomycetota bacterium]|nr:DUF3299 domain-containing protein [Planctomycetota bacterium]
MPRRTLDLLLIVVVGVVLLGTVYAGTRENDRSAAPEDRVRVANPHGTLTAAGRDARRGVDPFNPPGLPSGTTIDPETGLLRGLDLEASEGVLTPGWLELAEGNKALRAEDLPAAVRALDGQPVVLAGFMMALYAMRNIREFALVGSHTKCCFGIPPGVGDQVVVQLPREEPGIDLTLAPLRVEGIFRIRPQHLYRDGSGPLIWLYEVVDARAVPYGG